MKLIHCADLHLDSKLNSNFTSEKSAQRRRELLQNFSRLVSYALEEGVKVILIAGDLFDTQNVSYEARNEVLQQIAGHPQLVFFYLTGNHEQQGFIHSLPTIPKNLKLFREHMTNYRFKQGKVTISGMVPGSGYREDLYEELVLEENSFNIVMLHGQIANSRGSDADTEWIHLRELAHKNIDYLALGHVHAHAEGAIDARGIYVYPGCLEGRGYDECGQHGFELLDLDEEKHLLRHEFIPFALREIHEVAVELSGVHDLGTVLTRIRNVLSVDECNETDLARVILVGDCDADCVTSPHVIEDHLNKEYFQVEVVDETTHAVQEPDYSQSRSLKGEFVRLVSEDAALPDEDREAVLRIGIRALQGEEVRP